jgi:hypothetical protein
MSWRISFPVFRVFVHLIDHQVLSWIAPYALRSFDELGELGPHQSEHCRPLLHRIYPQPYSRRIGRHCAPALSALVRTSSAPGREPTANRSLIVIQSASLRISSACQRPYHRSSSSSLAGMSMCFCPKTTTNHPPAPHRAAFVGADDRAAVCFETFECTACEPGTMKPPRGQPRG